MNMRSKGFVASLLGAFLCGLLSMHLWIGVNKEPRINDPEISIVDFNSFRTMYDLDADRKFRLQSGREILNVDYAGIDDRLDFSDKWGVMRGGIEELLLLSPFSSSGLYYVYRDFEKWRKASIAKNSGRFTFNT